MNFFRMEERDRSCSKWPPLIVTVPTFAKILKFPMAGGWLESRGESSAALHSADVGVYIVPRVPDVDILICPIAAKDRYLACHLVLDNQVRAS